MKLNVSVAWKNYNIYSEEMKGHVFTLLKILEYKQENAPTERIQSQIFLQIKEEKHKHFDVLHVSPKVSDNGTTLFTRERLYFASTPGRTSATVYQVQETDKALRLSVPLSRVEPLQPG